MTTALRFFRNGMKDPIKGAKLQRCWYSSNEDGITIYAKDYTGFSAAVCAQLPVENDSDSNTDYFETDRIRVGRHHRLYPEVARAFREQHGQTPHAVPVTA